MDRNQLTALLLMFLMLTIYFQFMVEPPKPPKDKEKPTPNVAQQIAKQSKETAQILQDSAKTASTFGEFAPLMQGKATTTVLENEKVKITFSSQGGRVQEVILKKYNGLDKKPLILNNEKSTAQTLVVKTLQKQEIDLYSLYYEASDIKTEKDKTKLQFTAKVGEGRKVVQTYTLGKEGYLLDYDIKLEGLDKIINTEAPATFSWQDKMRRFEEDLYQTRYYTTVNFATAQGEFDYLTYPSDDVQERKPETKLHWVSFKQRFFTQAFVAKNKNLSNAHLWKSGADIDEVIKTVFAKVNIPTADMLAGKAQFTYYYGPNRHQDLNATNIDNFGRNLYLGWDIFGFFAARVVIPIFAILENVTGNYGLILILLVLIIKVLVLPLTYQANKAQAKMSVVNDLTKPDLEDFKKKNELDKSFLTMEEQQKVQQEQMRLSQELGVSPFAALGGCLPMLLQMPIFIAMFLFVPGAIELRGEAFLWAHDLSTYDAVLRFPYIWGIGSHLSLFTLLMTASTLLLTYYTSQGQAQMQGPNKYIAYIMPVMFIFVLNSSPAGLSFYYLVQNMFSVAQQVIISKYFIDKEKIRLGYENFKKNNKDKASGKTKMQLWLEEAQRKAQERAEAQRLKKNNPKS